MKIDVALAAVVIAARLSAFPGEGASDRCASMKVPQDARCTGCPPMYNGKLCASTTRYNDQTKGACGCGEHDPIPEDFWTLKKYTAALNCKNLDVDNPLLSWCSAGCGSCYELCSTGGGTTSFGNTTGDVCRRFKITNRCGDGYKQYPMWCSNEMSWMECKADPARCSEEGSTNWYGYPAHFDLQDFHLQISQGLGWDNVEVTFEAVPCEDWDGDPWDCHCAECTDLHGDSWHCKAQAPPEPATPAPIGTVEVPKETERQEYTSSDGYISIGGDVLQATMTVAHAKEKCAQLEGCKGFTMPGVDTGLPTQVVFKNKWDIQGTGWTSYRRVVPSATAAPVPSPAAPAQETSGACSEAFQQCGGQYWTGPTCCKTGCSCKAGTGSYYSQCAPDVEGSIGCQELVPATTSAVSTSRSTRALAWTAAVPVPVVPASTTPPLYIVFTAPPEIVPASTAPPSELVFSAPPAAMTGDSTVAVATAVGAAWSTAANNTTSTALTGCAGIYQQCGGTGWSGPTCCTQGYECVSVSFGSLDYAQCKPSGGTSAELHLGTDGRHSLLPTFTSSPSWLEESAGASGGLMAGWDASNPLRSWQFHMRRPKMPSAWWTIIGLAAVVSIGFVAARWINIRFFSRPSEANLLQTYATLVAADTA